MSPGGLPTRWRSARPIDDPCGRWGKASRGFVWLAISGVLLLAVMAVAETPASGIALLAAPGSGIATLVGCVLLLAVPEPAASKRARITLYLSVATFAAALAGRIAFSLPALVLGVALMLATIVVMWLTVLRIAHVIEHRPMRRLTIVSLVVGALAYLSLFGVFVRILLWFEYGIGPPAVGSGYFVLLALARAGSTAYLLLATVTFAVATRVTRRFADGPLFLARPVVANPGEPGRPHGVGEPDRPPTATADSGTADPATGDPGADDAPRHAP